MASRDFYEVLGVKRSATADEIKSAYRQQARKLHPDVNKAPDAQRKFTEVQNAYDVLSDASKRSMYDQFGAAAFESGAAEQAARATQSGRTGGGPAGRGPHYSWSNVGNSSGGGFGSNFDPDDISSIFESMFGQQQREPEPSSDARAGGQRKRAKASKKNARAEETQATPVPIDFLTAANGGRANIRVVVNGQQRTFEVVVPPGAEQGSIITVPGAGEFGDDLALSVQVQPHRFFRRGEYIEQGKGLDLYIDVPVTIAEATLGGSIAIPTIAGKSTVELAVPAGTPSGRKMRLKGLGLKDGRGSVGDLYTIIKIVPPPSATLSPHEATLLREIASRGGTGRQW